MACSRRSSGPSNGLRQASSASQRGLLVACLPGRVKAGDDAGSGRGENGTELGPGVPFGLGADQHGNQVRRHGGAIGN